MEETRNPEISESTTVVSATAAPDTRVMPNPNTGDQRLPVFDPAILKNLAAWAGFKAIIDIIVGALACLGIITAAYGVPQIISGVKLLNASEDLKRSLLTGDPYCIGSAMYNLNRYFKLSGIAVIVKACMIVLLLVIYAIIIIFAVSMMPQIFDNFSPGDYFN